MSWARYDDELSMNKKIAALRARGVDGLAALGLQLLANTWSHHEGTAGHVPDYMPAQLAGDTRLGRKLAGILDQVGMFDPADGGWLIHDFEQYGDPKRPIESAADRRSRRAEVNRENGRKGGIAKAANKQRDSEIDSEPSSESLANEWRSRSPVPGPVPVSCENHRLTDDSRAAVARSSSSVGQVLDIASRATWMADPGAVNGSSPAKFIAGIRRNMQTERADEIQAAIDSGASPLDAASALLGARTYAQLAAAELGITAGGNP